MTTLSIIIPTIGRVTLTRTLMSVFAAGLRPDDDVIVLGDTHSGPLTAVEELVTCLGTPVRYLGYDAGYHALGHPQVNWVLDKVRGDYVTWLDDDDVYLVGAFDAIRTAVAGSPGEVFLFRFRTPGNLVVPHAETTLPTLTLGNVSGQSIVFPPRPDWYGAYTDDYCGDWSFIESTIQKCGMEHVMMRPELISVGRPLTMTELWLNGERA